MYLSDVVFLQIPEKNIYYCKHNIFRSSIQIDTEDMTCFQTKLPKTKIFQFQMERLSLVVSAFLCWENSFSYIHLQCCGPSANILNTKVMYLCHEYKYFGFSFHLLARNKHFMILTIFGVSSVPGILLRTDILSHFYQASNLVA